MLLTGSMGMSRLRFTGRPQYSGVTPNESRLSCGAKLDCSQTEPQLERSPSLFTGNVIAGTDEFENPGDSPRALHLGFVLPQHPSELLIKHLRIVRLGRLVTLGIGLGVRTDRGQFLVATPVVGIRDGLFSNLVLDVAQSYRSWGEPRTTTLPYRQRWAPSAQAHVRQRAVNGDTTRASDPIVLDSVALRTR